MADAPSALAADTLVASRYRITRTIGAGGMATVYHAYDTATDRKVAVKLLNPSLTGSIGAERFLREIALSTKLQHPLIVPVLDSGLHDGSPFFVMPFIEGESLRDRLRREKQLPTADAIRIARDILSALRAAHERNIVHRDIKPANILLSGGHAIVADFGIARAYSEAAADRVTESGIAVGTPGYMSPEQAAGETHLDGRADVYAVGCVLYEMLAGEPPYSGPTPQSIVAKQMSLPVPSLGVVRSTVPPALDRLLQRALAKAAADRIATAGEFDAGLELLDRGLNAELGGRPVAARSRAASWLVTASIVAAAALGLFLTQPWSPGAPGTLGDTTRYVVLAPVRVDVPRDVLPDLPELLREALARWSGITVADSTARGSGRHLATTLSRAGDSLRLRVVLTESNGSLLADHTERLSTDRSASVPLLAQAVVRVLFREGVPPNDPGAPAGRSLPSRQAFVRGMVAVDRWQLPVAESLFQSATVLDRDYARANLWMALTRSWRDVEAARWRAAAQQALAGSAGLTVGETRLAQIIMAQANNDFPRACAGWRNLTREDPNDALAWFGSAHCQRKDALVVPDPASASGYRFRTSYHRALQDYRRAFQLRPAILAAFGDMDIRVVFRAAGVLGRTGWTAAPDSQFLLANAEWQGDTLAYVPYPRTASRAAVSPARAAEAARQLRLQVRDAALGWVTAVPTDPAARELLALALAELGDNTALDTIAIARRHAIDRKDQLRIAVSTVWLQLGAALAKGRPELVASIPGTVDSLLRANPPPTEHAALLTPLAMLTGRGHAAAAYARSPGLDRDFGISASLRPSAASLLIYASLGGPPDSILSLEARTEQAILGSIHPTGRLNERLAVIARAATMAYPAVRMQGLASLAGKGDGLLDLQVAFQRGNYDFVRDSLERMRRVRRQLLPETITFDALGAEVQLLVALNQPALAAAWIDPPIAALWQAIPRIRSMPVEAGSVVRVLAARARIAAELGQRSEAVKWAQFSRLLWSGADPYLLPLLDSLPAPP